MNYDKPYCKKHGKNNCKHTEYDHTFIELLGEDPFEVEKVLIVKPRYDAQNKKNRPVANLITEKWGVIASGAEISYASSLKIKNDIEGNGAVMCKIIAAKNEYGHTVGEVVRA